MKIIIPTRGRLNQQLTMQNLPVALRDKVAIVCPDNERFFHQNNWPTAIAMPQPDPKMGIGEKRKWIVETFLDLGHQRIVMLDDDLRFAVRREDDPSKFRKAETHDIIEAFQQLDTILCEDIPHAGFAARGGGISDAAQAGGWQEGKRMMYVLGYYLPTVLKNAEFGRLATHEDMDICLQLLGKGFPNMVNHTFVVDQKFGNAGGCTNERTVEGNNADAVRLAELHPGYVRTTIKEYKASTSRIEVVCQWKKCLQDGKQRMLASGSSS